jgi:hypothetical protein
MIVHDVTVHPERDRLPCEEQLAWKIAAVATDPVPVEPAESRRFLELVQRLPELRAGELTGLNVAMPAGRLDSARLNGIFGHEA